MSLHLKPGVSLSQADLTLKPPILVALQIVAGVYARHGISCVITSALDGKHKPGSLHYSGLALDFRTKNIPVSSKPAIIAEIAACLGKGFDVLLEWPGQDNEHLHVEYDPK